MHFLSECLKKTYPAQFQNLRIGFCSVDHDAVSHFQMHRVIPVKTHFYFFILLTPSLSDLDLDLIIGT